MRVQLQEFISRPTVLPCHLPVLAHAVDVCVGEGGCQVSVRVDDGICRRVDDILHLGPVGFEPRVIRHRRALPQQPELPQFVSEIPLPLTVGWFPFVLTAFLGSRRRQPHLCNEDLPEACWTRLGEQESRLRRIGRCGLWLRLEHRTRLPRAGLTLPSDEHPLFGLAGDERSPLGILMCGRLSHDAPDVGGDAPVPTKSARSPRLHAAPLSPRLL